MVIILGTSSRQGPFRIVESIFVFQGLYCQCLEKIEVANNFQTYADLQNSWITNNLFHLLDWDYFCVTRLPS